MNPYAFWGKLLGLGLVVGTAIAAVKLIEKVWPELAEDDFEYTAVAGDFPEDAACAVPPPEAPETDGAAPKAADAPNENPVDAPPAAPVTDPLKIADPADFQDWDGLGCQG